MTLSREEALLLTFRAGLDEERPTTSREETARTEEET